jgi:transposase-like protein
LFVFRNAKNKLNRWQKWFELWIAEGYSVRQISGISHHGRKTIKGIIGFWLAKLPAPFNIQNEIKYLLFDGTYFQRKNCLMLAMNNANGQIITNRYLKSENYLATYELFKELSDKGIKPVAITIDGNTSVIRALKDVWPNIVIQRCIVHIQRQGLSWLRMHPKLEPSIELRKILLTVTRISNYQEKQKFISDFRKWERKFGKAVSRLDCKHKVFSDLQRTRSLVIHAMPNMFHYLDDQNIAKSTNKIEGYFSRLKKLYRQHSGLSKDNRNNYFSWYIHFKNH